MKKSEKNVKRENTKETKKAKVTKPAGKRGYTPFGYPVGWLKSMSHDEAMVLLDAQVGAGNGKKFAVKKPAVAKTPGGRKGYTTAGYPIVWLRSHTPAECEGFLARGETPPKKAGTRRVRAADTGMMVNVSREPSTGDMAFDLGGIPVTVSVDKRQYTVNMQGLTTHYCTLKGLISGVREQAIRAGVKENAENIKNLNDLADVERAMTRNIEKWASNATFAKPGDTALDTMTEPDQA